MSNAYTSQFSSIDKCDVLQIQKKNNIKTPTHNKTRHWTKPFTSDNL